MKTAKTNVKGETNAFCFLFTRSNTSLAIKEIGSLLINLPLNCVFNCGHVTYPLLSPSFLICEIEITRSEFTLRVMKMIIHVKHLA